MEVAFADYGDNTIGFRLGNIQAVSSSHRPDIPVAHLLRSAGGNDEGYGIAVDTVGDVYVTGL